MCSVECTVQQASSNGPQMLHVGDDDYIAKKGGAGGRGGVCPLGCVRDAPILKVPRYCACGAPLEIEECLHVELPGSDNGVMHLRN